MRIDSALESGFIVKIYQFVFWEFASKSSKQLFLI